MTTAIDALSVVTPADHVLGPPQGAWTYDDYLSLPDDGQRYEMIDGVLYMAPPPTEYHQFANNLFQYYLTQHVQLAGLGRVIGPSFDVILGSGQTVQPDVMVVLNANLSRITPKGVVGAPDLVIEIASPSTATYDRSRKLRLYEGAGVPEYWIADPYARTVEVQLLDQGVYRVVGVFQGQSLLPSQVVPGLPVRVEQFFA